MYSAKNMSATCSDVCYWYYYQNKTCKQIFIILEWGEKCVRLFIFNLVDCTQRILLWNVFLGKNSDESFIMCYS